MRRAILFVFLVLSLSSCSLFTKRVDWRKKLRLKCGWFSVPYWMKEQIRADLDPLDPNDLNPNKLDQVLLVRQQTHGDYYLVRYRIKDNGLGADYFTNQNENSRSLIFERCLRELLSIVKVPDVDIVVSLSDSLDGAGLPAPVFAFAKNSSLGEPIILIPDFEALDGNHRLMDEVKKGIKNILGRKGSPNHFGEGR